MWLFAGYNGCESGIEVAVAAVVLVCAVVLVWWRWSVV